MNKLLAVLVASTLAFGSAGVIAADAPKDKAPMMKLEKPASVSDEAWAKMSDADKKKAVESSKTAMTKKPKKGGC